MRPEASPEILLVHGAWHGGWCWERQFAPWLRARGHVVHCPDLPRHGGSGPRRIGFPSIRDYVDAVAALLERQQRPMVVAGHSMGGFVVQKLMERQPRYLAGAALLAAAPPQGVFGVVAHLLQTRPLDLLRAVGGLDLYYLVREPRLAQALFYSDSLAPATVESYWRALQNESFRAFLDMLMLDLPQPRRCDPRLPKWIVGGERDAIFPPAVVRRTAQDYQVAAKVYPGMAHNLMLEPGWEQVASDFSDWVQRLAMSAPRQERAA